MDIERGLELPRDSNLEGLPRFQGARSIKLSTAVESAAGKPLAGEPLRIHCSTKSGRLAFTRGWYGIARYASLKSGDIVSFYKESPVRAVTSSTVWVPGKEKDGLALKVNGSMKRDGEYVQAIL
ncbi:unnamed protein product [Dovyalis caffra]|uniref:TF-B3 domain-containing protein n=1 Tax=Dovyalis caffra TaxID=77055 RepID=A0AAV1SUB8_9ROSI|nr:unnamed protein product [Dovyalis caffra]